MLDFDLVRVFADGGGAGGWPVAVFLAGEAVDFGERPGIAATLPVTTCTFVDDRHRGCMESYTATGRLPMAVPGMIAAARLLELSGFSPEEVRSHGGRVPTWRDGDLTWARARPEWAPELTRVALDSPAAVEEASAPAGTTVPVHAWAWEDEGRGEMRSRLLASREGAGGDEIVGIGLLSLAVGRPITLRHGDGWVLESRPGPDGTVEVGGRVTVVAATDYETFQATR